MVKFHVESIGEIFALAREHFQPPEGAEGTTAAVQLDIHGEGGGEWHIDFAGLDFTVVPGKHAAPDIWVSVSAADCIAVVNGELNPVTAYMRGRINFTGDMQLIYRLQNLFVMPDGVFPWARGGEK